MVIKEEGAVSLSKAEIRKLKTGQRYGGPSMWKAGLIQGIEKTDIHELLILYMKITSVNLLYNAGNLYSVLCDDWETGKDPKGRVLGWVHVHMANSLRCTEETNLTL